MGEKNEIKVKLSTVILLFIIFILIIALGITYYFGFVKNKNENKSTNIIQTNTVEKNKIQENTINNENKISNTTNKFKPGKYIYSFTSENNVYSFMALEFKDDNTVILVPPFGEDIYLIGTYKIEYQEEPGFDIPGDIYVIKCNIDKWSADNLNNIEKKAFVPGEATIIILDEENVMIEDMTPIKLEKGNKYGIYFGEGVKFTLQENAKFKKNENINNSFKPEDFKPGVYKYSFTSKNGVESEMMLSFKEDNTMTLIPHRSNGLYFEGTYKIEHQKEDRIDLTGDIYIIKCNIDKWSFEPSGDTNQKAVYPGNAEIVILDKENLMIYDMDPILLREGDTDGIHFGEGVKFTLEK